MNTALLIGAILAATLGSAMLALSQQRHWKAVTGLTTPAGKLPRRLGWLLLAASLVLVILRDGASFGVLFWPMLVGLGALLTAAALTWAPGWMKPLASWCVR